MEQNAPKGRLSDVAFDLIRQQIIRCELKPGSEITESALSESYNLGKAPIRAALVRLSQQGLVRPMHRRGYMIAPITLRGVNDIFQVRLFLEPQASRLAATARIQPDQIECLDQLRSVGYSPDDKASAAAFLRANRDFHVMIASLTENDRLPGIIGQLLDEVERLFHLGLSMRNRSSEMLQAHGALFDALKNQDPQGAERVSAEEIVASKTMVMEAILSRSEIMDVNLASIPSARPQLRFGTAQH